MKPKWIAVAVFWAAFLCYMVFGLRSSNKWVDAALPAAGFVIVLLLGLRLILRCLRRRSTDAFWDGRGYPEWLRRFAADDDEKAAGSRPDPIL